MVATSAQSPVSQDPITTQSYAYVLRLLYQTDSRFDVEDALQNACLQLLQYRPAVKNDGEQAAWLLKAARHCLVDRSRHADVYACVSLSEDHTAPSHAAPSHAAPSHAAPSHAAPESVVDTIVYGQILQSLPAEYRAVLELKVEGWTCAEIAAKLGLRPETAKKRFQRGRELLRKAMVAQGEPDPIR